MPTLRVHDALMHYGVAGDGPGVVLSMGQSVDPRSRQAIVDHLAQANTVLSYDPIGTGRSSRVRQGQSIEAHAADLAALLDALRLPPMVLIGHSTGTGVVVSLATARPSQARGLVLAAPWTHGDPDLIVLQRLRQSAMRALPAPRYRDLNALLLYPPAFRRQDPGRFAPVATGDAATIDDRPIDDADGLAARLDAILAFDARDRLARIACPTLVLGAEDDLVMPVWHAVEAAARIPGARLVRFGAGGHQFPESRQADFLRELDAFIATLPPGTDAIARED